MPNGFYTEVFMQSGKVAGKASKGTVGVESFQGRLRLRLPRQLYEGKQKYLTLGLPDTEQNRKIALAKAKRLESDIALERFDFTLAKYDPKTAKYDPKTAKLTVVQSIKAQEPALGDLWNRYTEHRKSQIAVTTLVKQYKQVAMHIAKLPTQSVDDAIEIRDWLLKNLGSADAARRMITQLAACCGWAMESKLIKSNPFAGMAEKVKLPKKAEMDIDAFSKVEMETIINAFVEHPTYSYYAPLVKFLFWTGCRTGEAIALQWKHVISDCSRITFSESVSTDRRIRKGTKTNKIRKFPCNSRLQALLLSIRPENYSPESPVFLSSSGNEINAHSFVQYTWRGSMSLFP